MIYPVTMYADKCDNCEEERCEYFTKKSAIVKAILLERWQFIEEKQYCPDCWSYGENNELVIDKIRFKNK